MHASRLRIRLVVFLLTVCGGVLCSAGTSASRALSGSDGPGPAQSPPAAPPTARMYAPPVAGRLVVVRGFDAPQAPYGPGHRGVDLSGSPGSPVLAAGAGTVRFAGRVAGRGVVVIAHADGITTEYEPLRVAVSAGQRVTRGQLIGRLHGRHGACAPGGCLHWGARRAGRYLDPLLLLRALGPVRLLPWPHARARAVSGGGATVPAAHARGCAWAYVRRSRSIETWV